VEPGVLCAFAEQAAAHPGEPHVLIVDELNRGNLPRIFGELLFLLEYRDQAVTLPYSKRPFRLPDNLYLLATMNPLDRSAGALDQALRRRFSFVDMPADAAVLASWLEEHPPAEPGDETFGPRVVRVFEELNRRLARDLGAEKQVGHSFFMVPGLDGAKLAAVWDHHVRPLLLDYLGGRPDRLREYTPDRLLGERAGKRRPV
jgi:5-methylcytosine-specific restriction endonuclease McrBC GTP-binding regulatory subunit McrB